jgi:hypothetical protein
MYFYRGAGSFSDYVPYVDGKVVDWMDEFDRARGEVYSRALAIRVIEEP